MSTRSLSWTRLIFGTLSLVTSSSWWRQWPAFAALVVESGGTTSMAKKQNKQPSNCLVYTHLQKSGGTTIKRILTEWQRCQSVLYDNREWHEGDAWRDTFAENLVSSECSIAIGGYTESLRRSAATQDTCLWFTSFRHPVSRVVSAFFYCKKSPGDPLCASRVLPDEAHTDVIAFAKHWGNFGVRQFAMSMVSADDVLGFGSALENPGEQGEKHDLVVRLRRGAGWFLLKMYLLENGKPGDAAGARTAEEDDAVLTDMLGPVQDLLRNRYAAVGIVEEFNTTLSLFNAALGTTGLDWHEEFDKFGVRGSDSQYKTEEMRVLAIASTSAELKSYIRLDLLLYEHAVAVFHEQAKLHGVIY